MKDFKNQVIWITGASSGIGEALVYALARLDAKLVISARREEELQRVKSACSNPSLVTILPVDISNIQELTAKVDRLRHQVGSIAILIHCAGISQRSYAVDTGIDVYKRIMDTNFFGTVQLTLASLPNFLSNKSGKIVVISSIAGLVALPYRTAYSASKFATEAFFRSLRIELSEQNISVLLVRPGAVKTNIAKNALTGDGTAFEQQDELIEHGMDPARCADKIVSAMRKNKSNLTIGSLKEKLVPILQRVVPSILDRLLRKFAGTAAPRQ